MDTKICSNCNLDAKYKCGKCKQQFYCGQECAKKDWSVHSRICSYMLIEGKRTREDKLCDDDKEVFTQELVETLPENEIFVIGSKCYHLPSLYNWVFNRGQQNNPLTNLAFPVDVIDNIEAEAKLRFPIKVNLKMINGAKATYDGTTLLSVVEFTKKLFATRIGNNQLNIDTAYEAFRTLVYGRNFSFKIAGQYFHLTNLFIENENTQLKDLNIPAELDMFVQSQMGGGPQRTIASFPKYIQFAQHRGWPTQKFIGSLQMAIDFENRVRRKRQEELQIRDIRRQWEEANPILEPPDGTISVVVTFVSGVLHMWGSTTVYVKPDALLVDALNQVLDNLPEIFEVTDEMRNPRGYIYAGTLYLPTSNFTQLTNFQSDNAIHVVY